LQPDLREKILEATGACEVHDTQPVQALWSGYGQIARVFLRFDHNDCGNRGDSSVIVKHVQPPVTSAHPRGWNTDTSAQRKLASYRVEANWYRQYADACRPVCALPGLVASHLSDEQTWLVLDDLDPRFPGRHKHLSAQGCIPCLRWLARFHGHHLQCPGDGLWDTGTYWHLKTRQDEYAAMAAGALKDAASLLDARLEHCRFKTLVHGDAKLANMCFSISGDDIAMVDFQYVGRGCGIRDVAYFLGSALTGQECELHGADLLDIYFSELSRAIPPDLRQAVETEWRALYATAWADFHRFLAGWMPDHHKINDYTLAMTRQALAEL